MSTVLCHAPMIEPTAFEPKKSVTCRWATTARSCSGILFFAMTIFVSETISDSR
jgi:hypothetical protein